jgi:hypothetical protein
LRSTNRKSWLVLNGRTESCFGWLCCGATSGSHLAHPVDPAARVWLNRRCPPELSTSASKS